MLTLITGNVASGKTSFALRRLLPLLLLENSSSAVRSFRNDMDDDCVERLLNFDFDPYSIILLDEVYPLFTVNCVSEPALRFAKMLETHRHHGYQFLLIAINPSDIHPSIKVFVEDHYHIERSFIPTKTVYKWYGISDDLNKKDASKTEISLF